MSQPMPVFLTETVDRYYGGVVTRLAEDLHLTVSVLARCIKGTSNLGPIPLLALASITGRPYTELLRLAGHTTLAEGLDRYYGKRPHVSSRDRALLRQIAALDTLQRRAVESIIAAYVPPGANGRQRLHLAAPSTCATTGSTSSTRRRSQS